MIHKEIVMVSPIRKETPTRGPIHRAPETRAPIHREIATRSPIPIEIGKLMKLLAVQKFLKDQVLDKYSIQTKLACSVIHVGACSTQMLNVKHLVEPTFHKLRHV